MFKLRRLSTPQPDYPVRACEGSTPHAEQDRTVRKPNDPRYPQRVSASFSRRQRGPPFRWEERALARYAQRLRHLGQATTLLAPPPRIAALELVPVRRRHRGRPAPLPERLCLGRRSPQRHPAGEPFLQERPRAA